jgi:hypothetical protein
MYTTAASEGSRGTPLVSNTALICSPLESKAWCIAGRNISIWQFCAEIEGLSIIVMFDIRVKVFSAASETHPHNIFCAQYLWCDFVVCECKNVIMI